MLTWISFFCIQHLFQIWSYPHYSKLNTSHLHCKGLSLYIKEVIYVPSSSHFKLNSHMVIPSHHTCPMGGSINRWGTEEKDTRQKQTEGPPKSGSYPVCESINTIPLKQQTISTKKWTHIHKHIREYRINSSTIHRPPSVHKNSLNTTATGVGQPGYLLWSKEVW